MKSHNSPHRLVVRTSRCGRDNPGSTPGVDIYLMQLWRRAYSTDCLADGMGSAGVQMEWVGAQAWRGINIVCAR
jgi:hypothetical protein